MTPTDITPRLVALERIESLAEEPPVTPGDPQRRVLLFFIDGIGVGSDDPEQNPLATDEFPTLGLTRSRTPEARVGPPRQARGLDASLGVPGLPQSATGQTAILTGVNAPKVLGHHMSGFPGPTLRQVLFEHSLLKQIRERGRSATFLNAFRPEYFERPHAQRRLSATSLATIASGARFRSWEDLLEGRAVTHDLTHWRVRERGYDLPLRTPEEAGAIIADEAMQSDFSLFEYFETDRAGHAQDRALGMRCLADLNRALETVLGRVDLERLTVLVVSDHGNLEDLTVRTHTMNPAVFAVWGPEAPAGEPDATSPRRLTDIAAFTLHALGLRGADGKDATSAA
jgi:2,3-bisphosphoglycerate-independent phosphoglycerate mutase